jgi:hypothetical protein
LARIPKALKTDRHPEQKRRQCPPISESERRVFHISKEIILIKKPLGKPCG